MSQFAPNDPTADLLEMLTYARPHGSKIEAAFVERFIHPLGVDYDHFGNAWKQLGSSPILWSCHTDTVHHKEGKQSIEQENGLLYLKNRARGSCLGADDGAGVWLMREMILAQVPGLYIFHAGEEHGCLGSKHIARERGADLRGFRAAIAFDRKGTRDIITHQLGTRCCSEVFVSSLSTALGKKLKYRPDPTGTFTDTASYIDLIGECTNLSVGYEAAHSQDETLDLNHLLQLRNQMLRFNPARLEFLREPGETEQRNTEPTWELEPDFDEALIELVYRNPEAAANLILRLGGNADDLLAELGETSYYPEH
jgi:hypothetical protein